MLCSMAASHETAGTQTFHLASTTLPVTSADTVPAAVQALYLQGNEIATHTMTHVGYPSAAEIIGCREWLVKETGIPRSKINGFRWVPPGDAACC